MTTFAVEAHHNEFLPADAATVEVALVVTASGTGAAPAADRTEIVILDRSGSMHDQMPEAHRATCAAIDAVPDGAYFAVIAGAARAAVAVGLTRADPDSRRNAKAEVRRIHAGGGTRIGTWLDQAGRLFRERPGALNHAILLTDGHGEGIAELEPVLARQSGVFQCDCRGIGTDWRVDELRHIARSLLGGVDIVKADEDLTAAFTELVDAAAGRATGSVRLRFWTPAGGSVTSLDQILPELADLARHRQEVSAQVADFRTGAWADETREYHLRVAVPPAAVGQRRLAARLSVVRTGEDGAEEVAAQALVPVTWTAAGDHRSTRINARVAGATGRQELRRRIDEGLRALEAGDHGTARAELGRAVRLAAEAGDGAVLGDLGRVVDIDMDADNAPTGTVRIRSSVAKADVMALDTRSTRTARAPKR